MQPEHSGKTFVEVCAGCCKRWKRASPQDQTLCVACGNRTANDPLKCNFTGVFDNFRTDLEIAQAFESDGWKADLLEMDRSRSQDIGSIRLAKDRPWARLLVVRSDPMAISGELASPEHLVLEIRKLLRKLALTFICRWRDDAGHEWQDLPMTEEIMASLGHTALSDEDRAAMADSYVRSQVLPTLQHWNPIATAQPRRPWWRFW